MKTFYDWNQKKVHSNDFLSVLSPLSQSELERQLWNDALLSSLCSPSSDPISSSSLQSLIQSQEGKLGESSRRIEESSHNLKKKLERELSSVRESRKELDQIPSTISKTEDDFLQLCQDLNGNENQIQGNGNGNHTAGEVDAPRANGKGKQVEDHTLMQSLQAQLQNLDSLKKAKDYLSVLARAQDLHKEVVEPATSSSVALESLSKLSSLLSTVQSLSSSSSTNDSSPLKAINFLKSQRNSAFTLLRDRRIEELSQALSKANWPPSLNQTDKQEASTSYKGKLKDNEEVRKSWKEVCQLQKEAQKLGLMPVANVLKSRTSQDSTSSQETLPGSDHYVGLLAVQTLLSPLLLRFRFHFDGDRNTNRLDKPEWYLSHISNLIKSQSDLFEPIFGDVARLCSRGGLGSEIDLSMELLNGLLTPLRRKIKSSVPLLLPHPSLLAHTILETINFDNELKESHTTARKGVVSISEEILGNQEWFESWLEGERSFCEERFDEFINSPDAWAISKDGMDDEEQATWSTLTSGMGAGSTEEEEDETNSDPSSSGNIAPASNETPTTKSARSLVSLLESVTERYCTLPSLSQRLAFLTRVQLPILRFYLSRLAKSLDAFESLSSAFVRAIPGGIDSSGITSNSDSEMVKGLRGLGRLLKALLSANHISTSLRKWGETSIFIDLAYEMRNSEDGKLLMDEIKKDEDEEDDKELREASLTSLLRRGIRSGTGAARNLRPLGSNKPATSTTTYTDQRYSGQQKSDLNDKEDESEIDSALFDPEVYDEKMNLPSVWDETCQRFQQIEKRASRGIEKLVISEALEVMREYSQSSWDDESKTSDSIPSPLDDPDSSFAGFGAGNDDIPSKLLIPALSTLSTHLSHFAPILPSETRLPIYRNIAKEISNAVVEKVVMAGGSRRFDLKGATRFSSDYSDGWLGVVSEVLRAPPGSSNSMIRNRGMLFGKRPQASWRSLKDAATLLSLPSTTSDSSSHEWRLSKATRAAFDEDVNDDVRGWVALKRELGLDEDLDVRVGREILRRRVECWK